MPTYIDDSTLLRAPAFSVMNVRGGRVAVDPGSPNWIASDDRGIRLLGQFDGRTPFADVVRSYSSRFGLDATRAWLHVETFARDALRHGFLSADGAAPAPYLGRAAYLETTRLREFWVQVNDFCNLACEHCLVSSGPNLDQGLDTDRIAAAIDQAVALGSARIFFTGGEPLARPDILELCEEVVVKHQRELVVLTNGTLLKGERLERMAALAAATESPDAPSAAGEPAPGLRLQISLDGSSPEVNDPIRGDRELFADRRWSGCRRGCRLLADDDGDDPQTQPRGPRGDDSSGCSPGGSERPSALAPSPRSSPGRSVCGSPVGRCGSGRRSTRSRRGVRAGCVDRQHRGVPAAFRWDTRNQNDLAGAGWDSLCLYTDGRIYPSASMAGVPELRCGDLATQTLDEIWKASVVCRDLRAASVEKKSTCRTCTLKFLCGGGDLEHGYWTVASEGSGLRGSFLAHDPYCDLYKGLADDTLSDLATAGRNTVQPRSGFDRPVVFRGMGDDILHDDPDAEATLVRTTHSACVLSEEVMERSRLTVRDFYGDAAEQPKAELCCPVQPDAEDLAHIPERSRRPLLWVREPGDGGGTGGGGVNGRPGLGGRHRLLHCCEESGV